MKFSSDTIQNEKYRALYFGAVFSVYMLERMVLNCKASEEHCAFISTARGLLYCLKKGRKNAKSDESIEKHKRK